MRILFYLPVVTGWWFGHIVAPLIRAAARGGEVHVMVPPLWRGTGIEADQLLPLADLDDVAWHILDGEDHPELRTGPADPAELLGLVHAIAPDLTLCRSADTQTPDVFPGVVRYLMEGGLPPMETDTSWVLFAPTLFDHGQMPPLAQSDRDWLATAFDPVWTAKRGNMPAVSREAFFAKAGLPLGRTVIGMPLEYEHPEMFFSIHHAFATNAELIDHVADRLPDDTILAVTNHPLNELYSDNASTLEAITRHHGKVRLVRQMDVEGGATLLLARHADGMIVGNSKSFAGCAYFGTPMLRLSPFRTGAWMNPYDRLDSFLADVRHGRARGAAEQDARSWFAFHLANNLIDPADPELTAAGIRDRMTIPIDRARWAPALRRQAELDALRRRERADLARQREELVHV